MRTFLFVLCLAFQVSQFTWAQEQQAEKALNKVSRQFFIENKGQWHSDVLYLCRTGGLDFWITKYGVNYNFYKIERKPTNKKEKFPKGKFDREEWENSTLLGHRVLFELQNHNANPGKEGKQKQEGYYNYLIGNDPSKHASYVGLYKEAVVKDVYNGIDLRYYFDEGKLRYDFVVKPGADPSQIKFKLKGQYADYTKNNREIVFTTRFGEVKMADLHTYQEGKTVPSHFVKNGDTWQIALGEYDKSKTLVIDPLIYSTYIGGSGFDDYGTSIAVDASGNAYVTGWTTAVNFGVTAGAYQTTCHGLDVFVTKLNATGTGLVYCTYLGGNGEDYGYSISVDNGSNAYVTGGTNSIDYHVTAGAYQIIKGDTFDVFVTKLNATGTGLVYSTFLGGSGDDYGYSIAEDDSGNAYVTGRTTSTDYDVTAGAYQTTHGGGYVDVFVTKLNATGTGLVYSTYLGGSGEDHGYSLSVDGSGNAYVTGWTNSTDFGVTAGAYQTTHGGGFFYGDAFVTKLNATGTGLVYSTYLGGSGDDHGYSLSVDGSGNAYVTGRTNSTGFDVTAGAYQTTLSSVSSYDVFVTKLNATGTALVYSTYLGGSNDDEGHSISVDTSGNAYVTGTTNSIDFDVTAGLIRLLMDMVVIMMYLLRG